MKRLIIIGFALVLMTPISLNAQHQTFLDVEMGGNPELFRYEIKKKGFHENQNGDEDALYGNFLGTNCCLWISEKNHEVQKLVINYKYDEWRKLSYEKAKSIAEGVVMIICKELRENDTKYFLYEDKSGLGPLVGKESLIQLENGWYQISIDGSMSDLKQGWMVFVCLYDAPENAIFYTLLQTFQKHENEKNEKLVI